MHKNVLTEVSAFMVIEVGNIKAAIKNYLIVSIININMCKYVCVKRVVV